MTHTPPGMVSRIYGRGVSDQYLTAAERDQRNADQRRRIWRELGWACIDLNRVMDDWIKQAIVNECIRQNGSR